MANLCESFLEKLANHSLRIGIYGGGYVGLPLALAFCRAGYTVEVFDPDATKLAALAAGESYLEHIPRAAVAQAAAHLVVQRGAPCDAHIICVPTPLNANREPDLGYVITAAHDISRRLKPGNLVVLESTTYPGTTREVLAPILQGQSGLHDGDDFLLAFSPEREDPGNKCFDNFNTPKLVGATTKAAGEAACALYRSITDKVVGDLEPEEAEMAKLLENIFRSVNIALVNEMKMLCQKMGIDVWKVIDAAKTKPFGFMPFYPGPGLGGHCIPIDPFYLTWRARKFGMATKFIELAGEINQGMPAYVVGRVVDALNSIGKPVMGSKVLVVGVAYKADVADCRETPATEIMSRLESMGADLNYVDPHVPEFAVDGFAHRSLALPLVAPYAPFDCAVVVTAHRNFHHQELPHVCHTIVDTRRALNGMSLTSETASGTVCRVFPA